MADLTYEILNDRTQYPDDMAIELPGGKKITVGEWRSSVLPKSQFTQESTKWAEKERALQGNLDTAQQNLAAAMAERERLAAAVAARTDTRVSPGEDPVEVLRSDPVFGPYIKRQDDVIKDLSDTVERVNATAKELDERSKAHEKTWMSYQYTQQLGTLGQYHTTRFNRDGKGKAWDQKAFLDFVAGNAVYNSQGFVDLGETYRKYAHDDEVALVTREAEERGVERGRSASRVPPIPSGRRSVPRKPDGPTDVRDVKVEDVENDPELQDQFAALGL